MIRVLYIDDEESLLELAKIFLERSNEISLTTTGDALEGLSMIREGEFDVVVSDYSMPVMDGLQILKEIRGSGSDLPFILFTGKGREEVVIQALNEGADFYLQKGGLPKPQFAELGHKIRRAAEERRARDSLRQSEARLQKAEETARFGNWELHLDDRIIIGSKGACRIYGLESGTISYEIIKTIPLPEYRPLLDAALMDLVREGVPYNIDFKIRRQSDHAIIDIFSQATYDKDTRIVFGVIQDVTELRKAERELKIINENLAEAYEETAAAEEELRHTVVDLTEKERMLRESEEKISTLVSCSSDLIFSFNLDGTYRYVNEAYARTLGKTPDEFIGHTISEMYPPESSAERNRILDEVIRAGKHMEVESTLRSVAGETRHYLTIFDPVLDGSGRIISISCISKDMTDRKRMEEALKESEERYRSIVEQSGYALWYWQPDGKLMFLNSMAAELLQGRPRDFLGKNITELFPAERAEKYLARIKKVAETGDIIENEDASDTPEGVRWYLTIDSLVHVPGRGIIGVQSIAHDITERKRADESLKVANRKLNLLGSISRHDTLNRVTALAGYVALMERTKVSEEQRVLLSRIKDSANSIASIANFTREYREIGLKTPSWQSVASCMDRSVSTLHLTSLKVERDFEDVWVLADPMFEKVVHNIIENAAKHAENATRLGVSFSNAGTDGILVFQDDGCGLTEEEKAHLFQPGMGKISGFGLFLSREILDITGIKIEEKGEAGKGARFEITVPLGQYRVVEKI